jgi:hypothetical protein
MKKLKMLAPLVRTVDHRTVKPAPKKADPFYHSTEWRRLMADLYAARGRRCEDCGKTEAKLYGDHVIELRDGGAPLDPTNVRIRCAACHTTKTAAARARRLGERY